MPSHQTGPPHKMEFKDRYHAGRLLAAQLRDYQDRDDVVVLALPRGGVVVGYEVAQALHLPLDVLVVRKIGLPEFPELAIGAISTGGLEHISPEAVRKFQVTPEALRQVVEEEREELHRREHRFRGNAPFPDVRGKTVLLVDDGLATGATMDIAVTAVRQHKPKEIVVAIPVAAAEICDMILDRADRVVCVHTPIILDAVGAWYLDFRQTSDEEVVALLDRLRTTGALLAHASGTPHADSRSAFPRVDDGTARA